ncbi:MAG: acyl-CoA dehydrogenase family protein, partial [Chloroflexota bacterium]
MNFDLTDEQREFQHVVQNFMQNEVAPTAHHTDMTGEFNWDAVRKMADLGLKGLEIAEEYGGADMDTV